MRSEVLCRSFAHVLLLSCFALSVEGSAQAQDIDPLKLEISLRRELRIIQDEEARLLRIDREASPVRAAQIGTIAGFSVMAVPLVIALHQDDTEETEPPSAKEQRISRIVGGVMIAGMTAGFTSLGFLLYKVRNRPHRAEALLLRDKRRALERDLKRVVREQEEGLSLAPAYSLMDHKTTLTLRYAF